jgi:hypothetical protein
MADSFNFTIEGYQGETRTFSIPMLAGTLVSQIDTEIGAVAAGGLLRRSVTTGIQNFVSGGPFDATVQTEMGLRVHWRDNDTLRTGYFTIPAPLFSALTITNNNVLLADASVMAALVAELETNMRSPYDNHEVTITRAEIVGRR